MKMARIVVSLVLLVAVAGAAHAQGNGCVTMSWNSCPVQVPDQMFNGPAGLYKLVISATGVDMPNVGHDTNILIGPNVPDAWRFDDVGCQTGSQLTVAGTAFSKTCPVMKGLNSLAITSYGYDQATKQVGVRLAVAYDDLTTILPATRYTLWQITFDHTYSVVGPTSPGVDCGEADQGLSFDIGFCRMLQTSGTTNLLGPCPGDARTTWQGGPAVPTVPASWGKVKGLYR
jgi:hypothetical protein